MAKRQLSIKYLIGIDEVGRGPLAGPVAVCAAVIPYYVSIQESYRKFLKAHSDEIRAQNLPSLKGKDSKKLSASQREGWRISLEKSDARFFYAELSALQIDRQGIAVCISKLIEKNLSSFINESGASHDEVQVLLDGGLKAPAVYPNQKTIIKGDEKEMIISFASIYAKVTRDAFMNRLSKKRSYGEFGFDAHKGYGTARHRNAIRKHGPSDMHRKSFLSRIL